MAAGLPPRVEATYTEKGDENSRGLPPLDYGDPRSVGPTLESTRPGRRYRVQHLRWFAVGLAIGALVAVLGQGGIGATCRALRGRSASRPAEPLSSVAAAVAPARSAPVAAPARSAPCLASSPCAELLAPFQAAEVHTVSVDDLPRAAGQANPSQGLTRGP
jgi:hypothetical protein